MSDLRSLVIGLVLAAWCDQSGTGPKPQTNRICMPTATAPNPLFERIAREQLHVETLATRNRDSLDFHEVSVHGIHRALQAAFDAGQAAAKAPT